MAKLLRICDYIYILAACAGEMFDEVRLVGEYVPSAMREMYGFVPNKFKRTSYLSTVSQMLSVGEINRVVDKKGKPHLELTSKGGRAFKRRFNLLLLQGKKWDGSFMIVIFDVPETQRNVRKVLRHKLIELGFGMLQKSVWISPYHFEEDMREFLASKNLDSVVIVLSAKKLWTGDLRKMAKNVWELERIIKKYEVVIKKVNEFFKVNTRSKKKILKQAYEQYLETLAFDPMLPSEFLPEDWLREKARKLLDKALRI
jgi:phenylacetic acid degradation operon negative regulatory protein